jgi:hypothetical protein
VNGVVTREQFGGEVVFFRAPLDVFFKASNKWSRGEEDDEEALPVLVLVPLCLRVSVRVYACEMHACI